MGIHIKANKNTISEKVLLPGDPLRAKWIAENFLEDPICYNTIRGMFGYTGIYNGVRVSVQGTGMGIPSFSIYFHELAAKYGIKRAIRIGTTGALQPNIELLDIVLALSASTDSNFNRLRFGGMDFAPCGTFSLIKKAEELAIAQKKQVHVGNVLTSDTFYQDDDHLEDWKQWAKFGVLSAEMESSALYTLGAKFGIEVLSILTVSDHLSKSKNLTPDKREQSLTNMAQIALNTIIL